MGPCHLNRPIPALCPFLCSMFLITLFCNDFTISLMLCYLLCIVLLILCACHLWLRNQPLFTKRQTLIKLSLQLCRYDYSGYGASSGKVGDTSLRCSLLQLPGCNAFAELMVVQTVTLFPFLQWEWKKFHDDNWKCSVVFFPPVGCKCLNHLKSGSNL